MGIGVVLLAWAVVGTVLACVGALVMGTSATFLTRKANQDRSLTLLAAIVFPFACLGWAGAIFAFQAVVNSAMHRDPGVGDSWQCPLPNGYAILMIDETDHGWVYNPRTQSQGGVAEQDDSVACVRIVQVAGRYILGGVDSRGSDNLGKEDQNVDFYFLLDTQTGKRTVFSARDALQAAAAPLSLKVNLEPIAVVYSRYRYTWFDVLSGVLFFLPPVIGLTLLIRKIVKLRRTRVEVPART